MAENERLCCVCRMDSSPSSATSVSEIVPTSCSSILMSTESVFGVIFSVIFLQEALNGKLIIGFALIFAAVLISQLNLAPIKRVACPLHAQRTSRLCKTER